MAHTQVAAQSKYFGAGSQTDLTGSLVSSVSRLSLSRAIHSLVKIIKTCVQPPRPHPFSPQICLRGGGGYLFLIKGSVSVSGCVWIVFREYCTIGIP